MGITKEQFTHSSHCYCQPEFIAGENDVVIDAGAAEGFISLECIDCV